MRRLCGGATGFLSARWPEWAWADAERSHCLQAGMSVAVRRANLAWLYDTSAPVGAPVQPPRLVASLRGGRLAWQAEALPRWAQSVLTPAA
jgi:hypothetical protein